MMDQEIRRLMPEEMTASQLHRAGIRELLESKYRMLSDLEDKCNDLREEIREIKIELLFAEVDS